MISPADLTVTIPPIEMLGGIFPRKNVSIIASRPGVGKSMFCLWSCCQFSVGGELYFGRELEAKPRRVVYMAGEAGMDLFTTRLQHCFEPRNLNNIYAFSAIELDRGGLSPFLNVLENAVQIFNIIEYYNPDVVIFDSLMSFMSCNESDAGEMNRLMSLLKRMADKTNSAFICSHHLRKRDAKARGETLTDLDEIIGSSIITRSAGCAFLLSGSTEAKVLRCVKSWWQKSEDLRFTLSTAVDGKLAFLPTAMEPEGNTTTARIRCYNQLLRFAGHEIVMEDFTKKYGFSRTIFYEALKELDAVKSTEGTFFIVGKKSGTTKKRGQQ